MSKIVFSMVAVILMAPQVHAETDHAPTWQFGIKAGLGGTTYTGSGANNHAVGSTNKLTFIAGGVAGARLHTYAAAQIEVLYTSKGSRAWMWDEEFGTYYLDYLEIPLLMKLVLPVSKRIECTGYAGPGLGILLDATLDGVDGTTYELEDKIRLFDFSAIIGIGAAWQISPKGAVMLDARYDMGLINIEKNLNKSVESMNRAFYFMLGYRY